MSNMSFRGRSWIFTINNFQSDDLSRVAGIECEYIIYGIERGVSGTPHLQGFIHFTNAKSRSAVARLLPRAFLEKRRGSVDQAVEYCKKDGLFTERGTKPIDAETQRASAIAKAHEKYREIIAHAKSGDFPWIELNHPHMWISRCNQLLSMRTRAPIILDGDLQHEWWVGKTGTGKSKLVWEIYPNHYQKQLNKWWDGYCGEEIVVIEEWSPKNEVSGSQLKIWADRYPFPGQIKGGTLQKIRPRKIIVLSNYSISECFEHHQDRNPLFRRFHELNFPADAEKARDNASRLNAVAAVESVPPQWPSVDQVHSLTHQAPIHMPVGSEPPPDSSASSSLPNCEFPDEVDREMLNFLNGLIE